MGYDFEKGEYDFTSALTGQETAALVSQRRDPMERSTKPCAISSLPDSDGDQPCLQKKSFREDGGSLRGEGRPFSKRGPFPPQAVSSPGLPSPCP